MTTSASIDRLLTPRLFPFALDTDAGALQVVALSEADYRSESFLDGRLETSGRSEWLPWAIARAAVKETPRCHFIFHIGHVGSTLLSRLVGESPKMFSVREPDLLRSVALGRLNGPQKPDDDLGDRITTLLGLFSRTWRPEQTAVIKATSFVSEIAVDLMTRAPRSQSILMFVNPLAYLRTAMGGPATRVELKAGAGRRLERLHRKIGENLWRLETLSEGEVIAMSWLSETASLVEASRALPDRCTWINFETFLHAPALGLSEALSGLGVRSPSEDLSALLEGPLMRRYSKAPEHAYDADLRRQVLEAAEQDHGAEIRKGMLWLGAAATLHPYPRQILEAAAQRRARFGPL